jgi:hypothetical protein
MRGAAIIAVSAYDSADINVTDEHVCFWGSSHFPTAGSSSERLANVPPALHACRTAALLNELDADVVHVPSWRRSRPKIVP